MLHGGEGVGVARFLGDLPGLSRCGEVQSGFYFSPFFPHHQRLKVPQTLVSSFSHMAPDFISDL